MERGPLVLAALRPDATAVQLDELLADRESEPGTAGAAGDGVVELLERLEQVGEVVVADADPRVGDAHPDRVRLGHDADEDPPLGGKLDRVGQQIEQDLLDLRAIARQRRQLERHVLLELHLLAARERHRRLDTLVDQLVQVELLGDHLELPGLDTGEVEDAIDELEEVGATVVYRADVRLLSLRQLAVEAVQQHLREADDGVERRPELVRHAGQKLGLEPAGLHELRVGFGELLVEPRVLQRDGDLIGEDGKHLQLLIVEDVAGELLAHEQDPGELALDLQGHDQRRLDRVELTLGRLEVRRDLGIQLDLFLHQHPARPVQPLHDPAVDPDRHGPDALADGGVLAVDDERAALNVVDHQDAVGERDPANEPVDERLHQPSEIEDRAHPLAEVQERLVAPAPPAEHDALDPLLQPLPDRAHEHGHHEPQWQDDPQRVQLVPVSVLLGRDQHRGEHAPQQEVDRALLHHHVHVEEAVADDRRPEHQREDHIRGDAHRVHEVRRRHEPGEDDDAADQADQGSQQDQGRAVAPEAGVDVLVDPDQMREPVDEEEVEVD